MNNIVGRASEIWSLIGANGSSPASTTLVIGDLKRWKARKQDVPTIDGFVFCDIGDLDRSLLEDVQPQVILSPLVARDFDAIEIAKKLASYGYLGRYRAVAEEIPQPDIIEQDIAAVAPNLDFSIFTLPAKDK